jgi:hypothetical protein
MATAGTMKSEAATAGRSFRIPEKEKAKRSQNTGAVAMPK